jgi:bla regulator protein BlaR1
MTLQHLLRISVEAGVLAAAVAIACAVLARLRPSHRAILWWLVSAKLLIGLVPLPALRVAALPATAAAIPSLVADRTVPVSTVPATRPPDPSPRPPIRIPAWAWLAGAGVFAVAATPEWLRVRRWVRSGRTIDGETERLAIARASVASGLRRPPRVLAVEGLRSPLVTGLLRPTVLLPAEGLARLEALDLEMTLAHEMAHIARGDLWLGVVPAGRLFFFHPAAWIAEREYAIAREVACDEIVIGSAGADAFAYGKLLLRFATGARAPASIAMSRRSMLRRRILMIESLVRRVTLGRAGWALVALVALAFVPVQLVAKESREPVDAHCLAIGTGPHNAYVIVTGDDRTMCGDTDDIAMADGLRRKGEDIIWFRVDGQDWVVRDPATVAEARRLFSGVGVIGDSQSAIGIGQSKIGEEQSRIAEQQAAAASLQADLAVAQARQEDLRRVERELALAKANEASAKERPEQDRLLKEAASADRASRSAQDEARRQTVLAQRMEDLAREQAALGAKQSALGDKMQREIAEAQRALSSLLERAMKDGKALRSY